MKKMVATLRKDYRTAPLSEQDRVMLDYVVKLRRMLRSASPEDHAKLRAAGFADKGILQITLIAAWFTYINKVADALGVGRPIARPSEALLPVWFSVRFGRFFIQQKSAVVVSAAPDAGS